MSFNSLVGLTLHTITLVLMLLGFFVSPSIFFFAGIASMANGILLLSNTLITKAYIGTLLAPVMLASMVLLVALGATMVFPLAVITGLFSNYEMIVFGVYVFIFIFALIHVGTGL